MERSQRAALDCILAAIVIIWAGAMLFLTFGRGQPTVSGRFVTCVDGRLVAGVAHGSWYIEPLIARFPRTTVMHDRFMSAVSVDARRAWILVVGPISLAWIVRVCWLAQKRLKRIARALNAATCSVCEFPLVGLHRGSKCPECGSLPRPWKLHSAPTRR